MKEVVFNYDKKVYFPESLSECNAREYQHICRLAYEYHTRQISYQEFLTNAVFAILNPKPQKKIRTIDEDRQYWMNIAYLEQFVEKFFQIDHESNQVQLINHLTERKIKSFRIWFTKYHAPLDGFIKNTYGQWEDAVSIILDHYQFPQEENLYKVLAIFFLPEGEKYNQEKSFARVPKFKHLDKGIVYGFFLHITAFMNYLNTASVDIAGQQVDLSIIFDSNDTEYKSPRPGIGIKDTAFQMAESGVFGNYEDVRQSNLWDMLLRMYSMTKMHLDQKDQEKTTTP